MKTIDKLRRCLAHPAVDRPKIERGGLDDRGAAEEPFDVAAFQNMLEWAESGRPLSEKQVSWIDGVFVRLFPGEDEPEYTNEWSAGRVPRGREVATPNVLRNLPLRPPGRR